MDNDSFLHKFRSFFGLHRPPPANDFRNPIWGSDDDDDGDELYSKEQQMDAYTESARMHEALSKQIHDAFDMFKTFEVIVGDMRDFFNNDITKDLTPAITDVHPDEGSSGYGNIRDFYLKPGYHSPRFEQNKQDVDLDGEISSNEISGLLKKNDEPKGRQLVPFDGQMVPGQSFFQTIITTSVTKPDGTVETRRIVKNGNEVVEETTTTSGQNFPSPTSGLFQPPPTEIMLSAMSQAMAHMSSLFSKF